MYSALIAAAFFVGVIINDAIQKNPPMDIGKHAFFGFVSVFGLWAIEESGRSAVAWGLFLVPTFVFIGSFIYVGVTGAPKQEPSPPMKPLPAPPKQLSEPEPALQLPTEDTVCVELTFDPNKPKPEPIPTCEVSETTGEIGMPGTLPIDKPKKEESSGDTMPEVPPNPADILASLNKRLTPYTVCDSA